MPAILSQYFTRPYSTKILYPLPLPSPPPNYHLVFTVLPQTTQGGAASSPECSRHSSVTTRLPAPRFLMQAIWRVVLHYQLQISFKLKSHESKWLTHMKISWSRGSTWNNLLCVVDGGNCLILMLIKCLYHSDEGVTSLKFISGTASREGKKERKSLYCTVFLTAKA